MGESEVGDDETVGLELVDSGDGARRLNPCPAPSTLRGAHRRNHSDDVLRTVSLEASTCCAPDSAFATAAVCTLGRDSSVLTTATCNSARAISITEKATLRINPPKLVSVRKQRCRVLP